MAESPMEDAVQRESSPNRGITTTTTTNVIEDPDISTLCIRCLCSYTLLSETIHNASSEECLDRGFERDVKLVAAQDSRSRFKIWAVNIAALHKAHLGTSLDSRLRDATELRCRIIGILEELKSSLEKAIDIASGTIPNRTWRPGYISDSEEEDEDILETDEDCPSTSEFHQLFSTLNATNTNLMKISMIIRNSPSRDDYLKAASRYSFDPRYDIGHVKEKHGSAKRHNDWLMERLGRCITRRRQFLKYREEHHGKLARDYDNEQKEGTVALTKATTFVESKGNPQLGRTRREEDASLGSQTSYDQTIAGDATENKLLVPPPPTEAFEGIPFQYEKYFQCPYCYTVQMVKNRTAWKKHVFRDLRPYVCTFKECNMKMFQSRTEWFVHELKSHRRQWICVLCTEQHTSKSTFISHLETQHQIADSNSQLQALLLQSEESIESIPASSCSLCDEWEETVVDPKQNARRAFLNGGQDVKPYGTLKQFRRHLGRHMEQLALFALPMADTENLEDDDSGEGELESENEDGSQPEEAHELHSGPFGNEPQSAGTSPQPLQWLESDDDDPGFEIPKGQMCLRQSCGIFYDGKNREGEKCTFHLGRPIFGEGWKGWACCERRALTFGELLRIEPCRTKDRHLFVGSLHRGLQSEDAISSSSSEKHTPNFMENFEETQYPAAGPRVQKADDLTDHPIPSIMDDPVTHGYKSETDPYTIRCICGYADDDGNTIYCEVCDTWQHIECYYPDRIEEVSRAEFNHACTECKPRPMDRSGADEHLEPATFEGPNEVGSLGIINSPVEHAQQQMEKERSIEREKIDRARIERLRREQEDYIQGDEAIDKMGVKSPSTTGEREAMEMSKDEKAISEEKASNGQLVQRDLGSREDMTVVEEEALRQRLRERQMPKRRFSVGPGNRRHRVLYDDGVYRWE